MALDPERYAEQIDELLAAVDAALPGGYQPPDDLAEAVGVDKPTRRCAPTGRRDRRGTGRWSR
jgi:hypothetical protein